MTASAPNQTPRARFPVLTADEAAMLIQHGQTVGFFIPTARPSQVDLQALRDAADKLEAVMSLSEDDVEAAVRDFDTLRKGAAARRRAQT